MITETIKAIAGRIKTVFPDSRIFVNPIKQNLKNGKDNFLVYVNEPTSSLENMYSYETVYPFQIIYIPREELIEKLEVYDAFEKINEAIGFDVTVNGDVFLFDERTTQEVDQEFHVLFDITDSTPIMKYDSDLQNDNMEELIFNEEVKRID